MSPNAPTKDILPYNASMNPPRRAKRPRLDTDADALHPSASTSANHPPPRPRPQLLPKGDDFSARHLNDSPEHDSSDEEEDDYDPGEPAPAPKRRGRKPGPMSRTARESQRKLNHSRIEKARRTKINETLATLSNLVNDAEKQAAGSSREEVPAPAKKESKGEKEFKLDVLVKTVSYIQDLIEKVQALEIKVNNNTCGRCSASASPAHILSSSVSLPPPSPGVKRKRSDVSDRDSPLSNDEPVERRGYNQSHSSSGHPRPAYSPRTTSMHEFALPPPSARPTRRLTSASPHLLPMSSTSPCLPPISSWLPHPYLDPSCISTMSSPDLAAANPSSHLPTPPLSGTFRVPLAHPTQTLPALSLPGPAHPSLASSFASSTPVTAPSSPPDKPSSQAMRIPMPSRRLSTASATSVSNYKNPSLSPTVSPNLWTPEDETAASLLLQMSTSPNNSTSGSTATPRAHRKSLVGASAPAEVGPGQRRHTIAGMMGAGFNGSAGGHRVDTDADARLNEEGVTVEKERALQAETPSSLLGIGIGAGTGSR